MIKQLELKRFKKFKTLTVDLAPFSILMGENSSGKTTVLQALNLALVSLNTNKLITTDGGGNVRIRSKGVGLSKLPGIELADFRELYYGKRSRASRTEKWIGAEVKFTDYHENQYKVQITSLFGGFNIKCISQQSDLPSNPTVQEKPPLLISGFVGLSPYEERVFPVALIDRLRTGHVSSVIRNLVFDTKETVPAKYEALKSRLADDFNFYLDAVQFDKAQDLNVTAQYSEPCESRNLSLDFNASGSGFMQILQILAPIYRFCPEVSNIVLLDEPDAHLHPNLQTTLANSLRRIQKELGIQIIISTHSTSIIRSAPASEVIPITEHSSHCHPLTTSNDVEEHIRTKLDSYSLAKSIISGKLVFFEDTDLSLWTQLDEVLKTKVFSGANTVPVIAGRGKTDRVPYQIGKILTEIFGEDIEVVFVRDGDGLPDAWRKKLTDYADSSAVKMHLLEYFELESYLLNPELIKRVISKKYHDKSLPSVDEIQSKILNALRDTIILSRYNYDDCLEEEIYQAAILMNINEYRNPQVAKSEVRNRHSYLETLDSIQDLLKYGQGKQALSNVLEWLNSNSLNIGKKELIEELSLEDIPEELSDIIQSLISRELRANPTPLPSTVNGETEQEEIEQRIEQLMLELE